MQLLHQAFIPLLLSLAAGLATAIGGLIPVVARGVPPRVLRLMMGFSAGVMLYVSLVDLLPEGVEALGMVGGNLAFFGGMAVMAILDRFIPHEYLAEKIAPECRDRFCYMKAGLLAAIGLFLHNIPEGMAVFIGAVHEPALGVSLAIAIALHNIPEGIAVAIPVYAATGSRRKAFWMAFLSGLAEPLGALVAGLWLIPFLTPQIMGGVLAGVGGLMTYISFDELLPLSYKVEEVPGQETELAHEAIVGIILGMLIMAASLAIFKA
jgi:zinc transporter, ZIP family